MVFSPRSVDVVGDGNPAMLMALRVGRPWNPHHYSPVLSAMKANSIIYTVLLAFHEPRDDNECLNG